MNAWRLVRRSLSYHWRGHLGVLLGSTIAAAVLIGALLVGDSVKQTLRDIAGARLGQVQFAAATPERFFRDQLASELGQRLATPAAAVLQLSAVASRSDAAAVANRVQVLGVDDAFWAMDYSQADPPVIAADEVIINEPLARQLNVKPGDALVLRLATPGTLPRDMPLASDEQAGTARRVKVKAIVCDSSFGRFSLRAQQVPPFNAFVQRSSLQAWVDLSGRANILLVNPCPDGAADQALQELWQPADAELEWHTLPAGERELRSRRVFIDDAIAAAAPQQGVTRVLTYFVNSIQTDRVATPYSMVTAVGPGADSPLRALTPADDQGIVLNQWAADDLGVGVGAAVTLRYFVLGGDGRLVEQSRGFTVRAVTPIAGAAADPTLMPAFPGIADSEHCREWDPDIPIDLQRIRDKDEQYWAQHRGTPKAFITLAAGQSMWRNRFGALTALRYPGQQAAQVQADLKASLRPQQSGLVLVDVRQQADDASRGGVDFGGLFLGLSMFLIAAALILTALLFVFGVEQRAAEVGTLLAGGLSRRRVFAVFLGEGLVLAVLGAVLGVVLGVVLTRVLLVGLAGVWRGAVASAPIGFFVEPETVLIGVAVSILAAVLAMAWPLRRLTRMPAAALLNAGPAALAPPLRLVSGHRSAMVAFAAVLGAAALWPLANQRSGPAAAAVFFAIGTLLLIGGLALCQFMLRTLGRWAPMTIAALGLRHGVRRPGRSLATIGLLACGCFLVLAVSANRQDPLRDADQPASGTGGFALLGESSLPVLHDLSSEVWGLSPRDLEGVRVVALRVREGDDASCLNLNRAQTPRLLGVKPRDLQGRFRFARGQGWSALGGGDGQTIPAIADQATAMWALGKGVGDTIDYIDEQGRPFKLRLAALLADTVLQGNLIIDEDALLAKYPSTSGKRMFLIDAPAGRVAAVSAALSRALQDVGLELTPTVSRLSALMAVQNTYLAIFGVLGGLGLLLGSAGLAVVVLRNVLERRGELAVMSALGLPASALRRMLFTEHAMLLAMGLLVGALAALAALWPTLGQSSEPLKLAAAVVGLMVCSGVFWVVLAVVFALRGRVVEGLRGP